MVRHFNNLQTPLRSIYQYPHLADQKRRFLGARWSSVSARSLWELWSDDLFVSPEQRLILNGVEPFDEWEEFVLFASHYFLLLAANSSSTGFDRSNLGYLSDPNHVTFESLSAEVPFIICEAFPSTHKRRFAALTPLSQNTIGHHGGLGLQTRLNSTDVYMLPGIGPPDSIDIAAVENKCKRLESIGSRVCHTITSDRLGFLVVGGRASPDHVFQDCWLFCKDHWQRVEDLPIPLFRHCATAIALENPRSTDNALLIYGGKTGAGLVSDHWFLWRKGIGWATIPVTGHRLKPRFGAVMQENGFRRGILLGGMADDGKILSEAWEWTISGDASAPSISLSRMTFSSSDAEPIIGRLGASLVNSSLGVLLVGGVSSTLIPQSAEVIKLSREITGDHQKSTWKLAQVDIRTPGPRPLFVGHSTFASLDTVGILGGGAVCFSFGSFWNETMLHLSSCDGAPRPLVEISPQELDSFSKPKPMSSAPKPAHLVGTVPTVDQVQSSKDFQQILQDGQPVIMSNMNMGSCTTEWTPSKLTAKVGGDRVIVVHEASNRNMDFLLKNFKYAKKPFNNFIDEITQGSPQYLRSLSSQNPSGKPADISVDFPELAASFKLPPQLDIVKQKMHSSVLRISGPVTMWLHYDVMANVLCQIHGTKHLILYPPSDVSLFLIPPGTSSSSIDCFDTGPDRHSSLTQAHPQEALLQPGDVLYIPPLWLHTASPVDNVSISVNVFFRNVDAGYAPGRDVYGNRDLQAYETGRRDVEKISKSFDGLPTDMRKFYLERLADELKEKAQRYDS